MISRSVVFRLMTALIPIFLLFGVELSLRVAGIPKRGILFHKVDDSVQFSRSAATRYFSAGATLIPEAHPETFPRLKPEGGRRIMCLGGSTMAGYPYSYNGALPSLIRDHLVRQCPEYPIEVINLAVPAVGSYTVVDICRHVVGYDPDLIIVYTGHNEFYGALGGASTQQIGSIPWLIRIHLRMQDISLYRLMWKMFGYLKPGNDGSERGRTLMSRMVGSEIISRDSDIYLNTLSAFRANVERLCDICENHSIDLLFCEPVSNLRDQPPFKSYFVPGNAGKGDLAFPGQKDSLSAILLYEHARDLLMRKDFVNASKFYNAARDFDGLRFRANTEFCDTLITIAGRRNVPVVPLIGLFQKHSLAGIPGYDLFIDHLHPNLEGYLLIAKAIVETIGQSEILEISESSVASVGDSFLEGMALVTPLDRAIAYDKITRLMAQWPFLPEQAKPVYSFDDSILVFARRYHEDNQSWSAVHLSMADYYIRRRQFKSARRELEAVLKQAAGFWHAWLKIGDTFLAEGDPAKATRAYGIALELMRQAGAPPGSAMAKYGAGLLASGRAEDAEVAFRKSLAPESGLESPEQVRARYLLGLALIHQCRYHDANRQAQELLKIPGGPTFGERLLSRIREARQG